MGWGEGLNRLKRKFIQWAAFGITNIYFPNFFQGQIYKGKLKSICVPGLNCYSCPGAAASCPIGALQSVSGSATYSFSFYAVGLLLAFGVLLGRFICGFLCPFGLFQELIYKIPIPKFKLFPKLRYVKYVILVVFVFLLPVVLTNYAGVGKPAFCQFICPAGTLEGGIPLLLTHKELRDTIGGLFYLKLSILIGVVVFSAVIYRFFCKLLCPLGAIYGIMNRFSFYRLKFDEDACIHCGICKKVCGMDVDPVVHPDSPECIRCGDCVRECPKRALKMEFGFRLETKKGEKLAPCKKCQGCNQREN